MEYFAKIDDNSQVLRVIVVSNEVLIDTIEYRMHIFTGSGSITF